jgi:hypothetical protein
VPGPQGIQGPAGTPGEVWFTGSGAPAGAIGIVGDWYLNSANGDYYDKTASTTWTLRGSLLGPQGIQGTQGAQGIQGIQGPQGPAGPAGADSTVPGPQGPQGIQGPQGPIGPSGITTRGDLAVGDATGVPVRLPIGAAGHVLTSQAGTDPAWAAPAPSGAPVDATYVTTTANATLTAETVLAAGTGLALSGATFSLADNGVTNAKLADMVTARLKGRVTAGTGNPEDLTGTQATTLLDIFTDTLKGVAPSSGGGTTNFLRADGTWNAPPAGMANPMTAVGDVITGTTAGAPSRLAIGTASQVLTVVSGAPAWQTPAAPGMANPMTVAGDVIKGGAAGVPERLGVGGNGQVLTVAAGAPAWQTPAAPGMANPMTTAQDVIVGGASGAPGRLGVGADGDILTVTTGTVGWAAAPAATVADDSITDAKLRNSGACSVMGRSANTTGDPADISAATDGHVLRRASGALSWGLITSFNITADNITNVALRNSVGTSVIGRSASTTGDPADIQATADGHVLRRAGTTLGFGTIGTASLATDSVTNASLADVPTATLKGRVTAATGDPEDLTGAQATTLLAPFAGSAQGVVPVSTGGTANFLRADGAWAPPPAGMTNPMTAQGDLIKGGTSGAPTRLPIAANDYSVLQSTGTTAVWDSQATLQGLTVVEGANPYVTFIPTAGPTTRLRATAGGWEIQNITDGTTPLAIMSDRIQIGGERFLELVRTHATVRLTSGGGHQYDLVAGGTGSAYPGSFWIQDGTDGTVPLAIHSDRVTIDQRLLEIKTRTALGTALLRFEPTGGHRYQFEATGDGRLYVYDANLGAFLLEFMGDGVTRIHLGGHGRSALYAGAVDSGGVGYRQVITPNNAA